MTSLRRSSRQNILQESQHVIDAKGLLEATRLSAVRCYLTAFNQISGHIDDCGPRRSRSFENAAGGGAAVHHVAIRGQVQVAEKYIIGGAPEMSECFLGGRGAVHPQPLGREAFLKKHPEALFIVENEYRAVAEKVGR